MEQLIGDDAPTSIGFTEPAVATKIIVADPNCRVDDLVVAYGDAPHDPKCYVHVPAQLYHSEVLDPPSPLAKAVRPLDVRRVIAPSTALRGARNRIQNGFRRALSKARLK